MGGELAFGVDNYLHYSSPLYQHPPQPAQLGAISTILQDFYNNQDKQITSSSASTWSNYLVNNDTA